MPVYLIFNRPFWNVEEWFPFKTKIFFLISKAKIIINSKPKLCGRNGYIYHTFSDLGSVTILYFMHITLKLNIRLNHGNHRRVLEIIQFCSPFHNLPLKWFSPKHAFMRNGKAGTSAMWRIEGKCQESDWSWINA